jgi:glutathione S-transferase
MARTFYYGSGSPFAWKVWLALEHKQLAYDLRTLSFDRGETRSPEFLAVNPRGKVPTLVDDGVALWESAVILEYLEDRYPDRPLLPREPVARAQTRRIAAEVNTYLHPAQRPLLTQAFRGDPVDPGAVAATQQAVVDELERFSAYLDDQEFLAGPLSLADFTLYPHVRLLGRIEAKAPALALGDRVPANLRAWSERIAALPYHDRTLPPHWR